MNKDLNLRTPDFRAEFQDAGPVARTSLSKIDIEPSTFLIGPNGKLVRELRGVKVPGHAEEVFEAVKAI